MKNFKTHPIIKNIAKVKFDFLNPILLSKNIFIMVNIVTVKIETDVLFQVY